MATTYFAPANDLGALSRYQLQDEQQRFLADASKRQYYADLERTAAERYRAQQDAAARMFQTSAYRDVGMGQTAAGERSAMLPYQRMTPFQAAQIEQEKERMRQMTELYKTNPELMLPAGVAGRAYDEKKNREEISKIAERANANLDMRGGIGGIQAEVERVMNRFGHWYNPFGAQGMTDADAAQAAADIVIGKTPTASWWTEDAAKAGEQTLQEKLAESVADLDPRTRQMLTWDRASKRWRSIYDTPGVPTPILPPAGTMQSPPKPSPFMASPFDLPGVTAQLTPRPSFKASPFDLEPPMAGAPIGGQPAPGAIPVLPQTNAVPNIRFRWLPNGGMIPLGQ